MPQRYAEARNGIRNVAFSAGRTRDDVKHQNTPTMKRLAIILSAIFVCVSCGVALYPDRGVTVAASVNISAQPPWGPAGYDYAPYYYFPDFNFYYDVDRAMFHYYSRGRWIAVRRLPADYPRDLYKFYKVVIDMRDPWLHNRRHKSMYKKYRGIHTQPVLRDARDYRRRTEHRDPRRTPYRHGNPPERRDDRPMQGDIRNSRNNDTGRGYRHAERDTRPNRNGKAVDPKKDPAPTRRSGSAGKKADKTDKTDEGSERKPWGTRSAGSRGR